MSEDTERSIRPRLKANKGAGYWALMALHWTIIINFAVQIFYGGFMVFNVVKPEGASGPLWERAKTMPPDLMTVRRLYALETWVAIAGLAIYLAITEIGPRLKRYRSQ